MTATVLYLLMLALPAAPATQCSEEELKKVANRADFVLVAEVKEVEPSSEVFPPMWSGAVRFKDFVHYDLKEVLKGDGVEFEFTTGYDLIATSRLIDKEQPRLSPSLFKKGARQILFLEAAPNPFGDSRPTPSQYYVSIDQDCGAVVATDKTEALLRKILSEHDTRGAARPYRRPRRAPWLGGRT